MIMSDTPRPTNALVTPLLTDLYQVTMAYAHWLNKRHGDPAVFELFFRKNPFGGEYTIFAGLDECLKHLEHFRFTEEDIQYLRTVPALSHADPGFFAWLLQLDTKDVRVRAIRDGTVVFPRVPLMIIECPLAVGHLLETTLLTLVNYPSLVATNAARMVLAAAPPVALQGIHGESGIETPPNRPAQCYVTSKCVEFGLRRAQGPDGGFSASKYSALSGFVATSNVMAGKLCGLNVSGTHAHAFVQSYSSLEEVSQNAIPNLRTGESSLLLPAVLEHRQRLAQDNSYYATTNDGELAAFIAYATAFPATFLCLIDTYDTLNSGLLNFVVVAHVLDDLGYKPKGIRLDSGDLAYLSMECAFLFQSFAMERPLFAELDIVASNDINESVLHAINKQEHAITVYGIGTNLVTCQAQPALGWYEGRQKFVPLGLLC